MNIILIYTCSIALQWFENELRKAVLQKKDDEFCKYVRIWQFSNSSLDCCISR